MLMFRILIIVLAVVAIPILANTPCYSQSASHVYDEIGRLHGTVILINHPDLGRTPANFMYLVFRRAGCKKCLIGTKTDVDGKYELFLGQGRYELIALSPTPPPYDMIANGQSRMVNIRGREPDTQFDVSLKLQSQEK